MKNNFVVIMIVMMHPGVKFAHIAKLNCHDMCQFVTWSDIYFSIEDNMDFHKIWTKWPVSA